LHSQRKLVLALIAVLALGALFAGCGGGGSSSSGSVSTTSTESSSAGTEGNSGDAESSSGGAPTKVVFIKEADKICSDADAAMTEEITDYAKENNIPIEESEPSEDAEIELFHAVVLPNIAKQAEEIAALTPPETSPTRSPMKSPKPKKPTASPPKARSKKRARRRRPTA
jgi:hypothetical protein